VALFHTSSQFVADEKPFPVPSWEVGPDDSPKRDEAGRPLGSESADREWDRRSDFAHLISDLLADQARLSAELTQLRERTPQTTQEDEFAKFAKQSVQFIDAMERVVYLARKKSYGEEIQGWIKSVDTAYDRLLRLMSRFGLEVISCDGEEVDLGRHDVVEYRPTKDYPHNTVIETMLKGVVLRGRVLRDAKVIVACNQEAVVEKDAG
jgi:molecular chaperone GrpE